RRYETANGLAMDVQRYLAGEAVLAAPPSPTYRLRKAARRYRKPLATAAAFLALLLLAGAVTVWQALRLAQAERDRAEQAGEQAREQLRGGQEVHDALNQATALREQAKAAATGGAALFAQARERAQRALALVESGPADAALAAQVRQLQADLDAEAKD